MVKYIKWTKMKKKCGKSEKITYFALQLRILFMINRKTNKTKQRYRKIDKQEIENDYR